MKIDGHQHFWNYDPVIYGWINDAMHSIRKDFSPSDLAPVLQKNGIDGSIAVQADQSEEETAFLLDLGKKSDFIKGVVGWVDLNAENVAQKLEHFSKEPLFKGMRHTVYDKNGDFMCNPALQKGIAELGKLGFTYDILVFDYQLPGAIALAKKFPNQPFVLDHMAKPNISSEGPTEDWVKNIKELALCGNVHCKLSGLVTQTPDFNWKIADFPPFLEVVTEAFGTNRLMYGSDWPVCLAAASYEDTLNIVESFYRDSAEDLERIMGRNAAEFYRISI